MGLEMGVRVGLPPSSSSHPFASLIPLSSSSKSKAAWDRAISRYHSVFLTDHGSPFIRTSSSVKLRRSATLGNRTGSCRGRRRRRRRGEQSIRRALSASLERFKDGNDEDNKDDEFVRRLKELVLQLRQEDQNLGALPAESSRYQQENATSSSSSSSSAISLSPATLREPWIGIRPEPEWAEEDELVPASVERNANSIELPLSLRIIKRKKQQWGQGFVETGESACSSIKRAFSSLVFIIQELQSHVLQMREALLDQEDLQGILARVQQDMHASFVWLFQQIFSGTPTLMISLMLLLANYTVYSMGHNAALAATMTTPNPPAQSTIVENHHQLLIEKHPRFDQSSIKSFFIGGRRASVGGNGSGDHKAKPVAGATDDGRSDGSSSRYQSRTIFSDVPLTVTEEEAGQSGAVVKREAEEEAVVWNRIVEEATRMEAATRDETLMDHGTLQRFVSPVTVELEADDHSDSAYVRTELEYHLALSQDTNNSLLLSNFAQFVFLVLHDLDRAEEYFKKAVRMEPLDAEALNKYASFLWVARKDLDAAEETYLEAIAADPGNNAYAANYAHFLWNTGGEDTCYPIDQSSCY